MDSKIPEDTDKVAHLPMGFAPTLSEAVEIAKEKWGKDVDLNKIEVSAIHFHARCLGYDQYDSTDYDDYVVLELKD